MLSRYLSIFAIMVSAFGLYSCGYLGDPRVFGSSFDDNVYSRAEREEIDRREGREPRSPPGPVGSDHGGD